MQHSSQLAHRRRQADPESGIVLLMVVFLTFLMLLALAIAAPEWAHQLKRQRDVATIQCGQQYERAIQLYYRKFHRYPNTVKQLLHTNNMRFLRRPCIDPLTGKNDWKLVLYGHAHVHPLGLWGKPLSLLGSVQASGGMYAISGSSSSGTSGNPTVAGSATGGDNMGFGSSMSSGIGSPMGGSGLGSPSTGSSPLGASPGSTATGTGLNSPTGNKSGSSIFGSTSSSSDGFQTNAPFVGVVPPIKGKSSVDYRAQGKYSRWEFNYDPIVDMQRAKVSILGGSQSDLNGATSLNGDKNSNSSNSLFGGNNGFGNSSNSSDQNNKKKSGDKNSGSSGSGSNSSNSGSSDSGNSSFGSSQ